MGIVLERKEKRGRRKGRGAPHRGDAAALRTRARAPPLNTGIQLLDRLAAELARGIARA